MEDNIITITGFKKLNNLYANSFENFIENVYIEKRLNPRQKTET